MKLLDTIIQSLTQMRTLSIVDDSPDLATAVDARVSFSKAQRCQYLARSYAAAKRYAEALSLTQHASIHIRESRTAQSLLPSPSPADDPITSSSLPFYVLDASALDTLESTLASEGTQYKKDWFGYNGGDATGTVDRKTHKKPLFFDIALNYISLDMDRLQERAGKAPPPAAAPVAAPVAQVSDKKSQVQKAKVEEIERAATPEPTQQARGGLSSLLGGWWGRR